MEADSQAPKWISAIVAILVLLGGFAVGYANLNSQIVKLQSEQGRSKEDIKELDRYDVHLEKGIDKLKGDAIRMEVQVGSVQKSTDELKFTMAEMLKEMRRMNDNLITMGVKKSVQTN